nr:hypothetical protein [Tanacetum cinerariifolium]
LLWEGIHYSLLHLTFSIPYPRFTKIIIGHYMTNFLKISRRARDKTPSTSRSPTPKVDASAPTRSNVIRLRLPQWRSTRLTPPAPVLIVDKANELILPDTLQSFSFLEVTIQQHILELDFKPAQMKFERLQVPQKTCRTLVVRPRDQDDPHDDAHPKGENSAKR